MIYIVAGTNRPQSKTFDVAQIVHNLYQSHHVETKILSLGDLSGLEIAGAYGQPTGRILELVQELNSSRGIHFITPEYNGSFPGILKYFIDFFSYPETFEYRPVAFVGLGWRWGGLRPVEQLQQVFSYRNAYQYPHRVFIQNAPKLIENGKLTDHEVFKLLELQTRGFTRFIKALESDGLDANSFIKHRQL